MNSILQKITDVIEDKIKELPVEREALEENGKIYYMNGNDGTDFDWFVNDRLCEFMCFYDESKKGAIKVNLLKSGIIEVFLYKDMGDTLLNTSTMQIMNSEDDIFNLAVIMKKTADDTRTFDRAIDEVNTDIKIEQEDIDRFNFDKENLLQLREDFEKKYQDYYKGCFVSRKILDEGWKVGYFFKDEPVDEHDSGWCFMAGNEDEEYNDDIKNIAILQLSEVCQMEPLIDQYLDMPAGTKMIRVEDDLFEEDDGEKPVHLMKQE
jgi:hypothetical protein